MAELEIVKIDLYSATLWHLVLSGVSKKPKNRVKQLYIDNKPVCMVSIPYVRVSEKFKKTSENYNTRPF